MKFVAVMAKEFNDIIVMIRSFGEIVDCILLGTVNGSPVRLVGICEGDVPVFYSTYSKNILNSFKCSIKRKYFYHAQYFFFE